MSETNGETTTYNAFSEEELAKNKARQEETKFRLAKERQKTKDEVKKAKKVKDCQWVWYSLKSQMIFAQKTGNCPMAVQAVLYREYFKNFFKKQTPFVFDAAMVKSTGFNRRAVVRALRDFEEYVWIDVERRVKRSPVVRICRRFHRMAVADF